ncbi:hypothetical protein C479_09553 [Halovivax asiaticus JCM 14624]|uniref:Uncharacterized protein n=1 Tax=Halovivax asiaticus JCM 14624 TaxID=1227490 RepID=M0BJJ4_9EURY|nr:hypothetical protein [Halovivax asiaticus]ELZ11046.1 hypothetical protein C479_09553 [Halovivax asiaticus JCM 14624]
MEHTAEEYGDYWEGAVRIAIGVLLAWVGRTAAGPFLALDGLGPTAVGFVVFAGTALAGTYVAVLGLARVIRTAVAAERRR